MNLIVAVAKDFAIGKDNKLLFNIPKDMAFFKEKTINNVIVMGEKTYLSLPKRPLPKRTNIVLSDNPLFEAEGAVVVHNLDELFSQLKAYNTDNIFVCGGASIYNLLMPYCKYAFITVVNEIVPADTYIKDVEKNGFKLIYSSETFSENNHEFSFRTYENLNIKQCD